MTSNNLEAIELLKNCIGRLQEQGFSNYGNTVSELNKAIELLTKEQADEVQEHTPQPDHDWCKECICSYKKSIKEIKLKELKMELLRSIKYGQEQVDLDDFMQLLTILLEEEY